MNQLHRAMYQLLLRHSTHEVLKNVVLNSSPFEICYCKLLRISKKHKLIVNQTCGHVVNHTYGHVSTNLVNYSQMFSKLNSK